MRKKNNLKIKILTYKDETIVELIYAIFYSHQHFVDLRAEYNEKILTLAVLLIGCFGYVMSLRKYDFLRNFWVDGNDSYYGVLFCFPRHISVRNIM